MGKTRSHQKNSRTDEITFADGYRSWSRLFRPSRFQCPPRFVLVLECLNKNNLAAHRTSPSFSYHVHCAVSNGKTDGELNMFIL
jgi:hypothetical protein